MEELKLRIDGKEFIVQIEDNGDDKIKVYCEGEVYEVETKDSVQQQVENSIKKKKGKKGRGVVTAPLPGSVVSVEVKKGDKVSEGEVLVKLISMKMENDIVAPKKGIVKEINVKKNDNVDKGDILVVIE